MSTARVPLPDAARAPGVRDFMRGASEFSLREMIPGWGLVAPAEGGGTTRSYLTAHRLCDAQSTITDATWAPLVANPPIEGPDERRTRPGEEASAEWREKVIRHADRVHESAKTRGVAGADLAAVSATMATKRADELPPFLTQQAPLFFEAFQEGSLWYIAVDRTLMHRLTVMRALNALELTPDIVTPADFPGLRALEEHSITGGVRIGPLYDVVLTTFVPGALGFVFELMPHALVLLYGLNGNLSTPWPPTAASLYQPHVQAEHGLGFLDADFFEGIGGEAEALLQWWTQRLNAVYSYIADPTRFVDSAGNHIPTKQYGWFLTFERMLADALLITTGFQGPALARQQAAFDLLDKAEALLGFTTRRTGKGFERLLRRTSMLRRLDEVWELLPVQLRQRFRSHTRWLYDTLYDDIRAHAVKTRLTKNGVMVGPPGALVDRPMEMYVGELVRTVRNSAHGLLEQLMTSNDRYLIATHQGKLPAQLSDLAALLAFALVADAVAVHEGRWLPRP
jgi:hypothetical protein